MDLSQVHGQVGRFLDHHISKGSQYKDWDAAFRTWMRNAIEWGHVTPSKLVQTADRWLSQEELRQFQKGAWRYGVYEEGYTGYQAWLADRDNGTLPQLDGRR